MPTSTAAHVSARVNAFSYAIRNIVAEAKAVRRRAGACGI
jgi:hypothetical protein